MEDAKNPTD
ncbi:Protein of unknown function [Bacillus mycoides]|nr:Protein of unknown function [Bacillus mycoides]SCM88854.1 Protein of unknown function [Bacillus mycoides]